MINTRKLKAKIIETGNTIQKLAPKTGYTAYTLGQMISNKKDMSLRVSAILIDELGIIRDDIADYFYS